MEKERVVQLCQPEESEKVNKNYDDEEIDYGEDLPEPADDIGVRLEF